MEQKKEPKEIEKLSVIMSHLNQLYIKKKEDLEELKNEIEQLREIVMELNKIVTNKSFQSADQILLQDLKEGISGEELKEIEEKYFREPLPKEIVKDTTIKRKIFSNDEKRELLCILNFKDFNTVEIKFQDPELRAIKETSEKFLEIFVKGALLPIKEKNPTMNLKYKFYKNTDIIERITIQNLNTIGEFDLITSKISELFQEEP
ncbi:MAG: hypothetical protein ACTSYC_04660 [Promethearchaeota archaeon]